MPLSGPTFAIQPTQVQPTLNTYITVFNVLTAGAGNAVEIIGSASKTVAISRIFFTKPSTGVTLVGRKQSTASSGGTPVATTLLPLNSTNAAATAVVNQYTAVPVVGTLVGEFYRSTLTTSESVTIQFAGTPQFQNGILNGTSQTIALNVDAAATVVGFIEWAEYS